jgi:hypothetical protein
MGSLPASSDTGSAEDCLTIPWQPAGIDGDVAFAAVDLLGVVPARQAFGTVSAARMDWESMTAADGSELRLPCGGEEGAVLLPGRRANRFPADP